MAVHVVNLSRCNLDDVLAEPPVGHRGVYFTTYMPPWKAGDVLSFVVYNTECVEDVIVSEIESPGTCKQVDLAGKGRNHYKTHWIPVPKPPVPVEPEQPSAVKDCT